MQIFEDNNKCSGCTACMNICPKGAVKMERNDKGFLYPKVNDDLCIGCNMCKNVCAFNESYIKDTLLSKPSIYAGINKSEEERRTSRSGGVFMAFSKWVIENGGSVYGAAFDGNSDNKFYVSHKKATSLEELKMLKGSKYVQSDMKNIFKDVKRDIKNNKIVLFSGTPCQVAGIRKYLGNLMQYNNFYTCDIVCHGVPSPKVWQKYIDFIGSKFKINIDKADFRDKSFGWGNHKESFFYDKFKKVTTTWYANMFHQALNLRECCAVCPYANMKRPSDITIGDFWGIEEAVPSWKEDMEKGTSLVIVNTRKGKILFENSKAYTKYIETTKEKCMQPNLKAPSKINDRSEEYFNDLNNMSFEKVLKKYTGYNLKSVLKIKVKSFLNRKGGLND